MENGDNSLNNPFKDKFATKSKILDNKKAKKKVINIEMITYINPYITYLLSIIY